MIIAFPLGYYYKYKGVKAHSLAIVNQAKDNERIDKIFKDKQTIRKLSLKQNLSSLGLTDKEIESLYKKDGQSNKLKSKFTEYLPGETKWLKGDTVYIPRAECVDDYLGDADSGFANDLIQEGNNNRLSNQ